MANVFESNLIQNKILLETVHEVFILTKYITNSPKGLLLNGLKIT